MADYNIGYGSALTLFDQAVISLLNFLTTIAVGKFAGIEDLGRYAVAFTIASLTSVAVDALVGMPYMARHRQLGGLQRKQYLGSVLSFQAFLVIVLAAAFSATAAAGRHDDVSGVDSPMLFALALAVPMISTREMVRRIWLSHLKAHRAAIVSLTAGIVQLLVVGFLVLTDTLSATTALLAIGVASLVSVTTCFLGRGFDFNVNKAAIRSDIARFGPEGVRTFAAMATFSSQIYTPIWLLALWGGTKDVGLLAACQSLVMLPNPLVTGLANIFMPQAARSLAALGREGLVATIRKSLLVVAVSMVAVCAPLLLLGGDVLVLLYGGAYAGQGEVVVLLALAFAARSLAMPAYIGLWAFDRSLRNTGVNSTAIVALVCGLPVLYSMFGLVGAATAVLLSDCLAAGLRWFSLRRVLNEKDA